MKNGGKIAWGVVPTLDSKALENITIDDAEYEAYLTDFATENGYENADDLKTALEANNEVDQMKEEVLFNKVMRMIYEKNGMIVDSPKSTEIEVADPIVETENTESSETTETEEILTDHQMKE